MVFCPFQPTHLVRLRAAGWMGAPAIRDHDECRTNSARFRLHVLLHRVTYVKDPAMADMDWRGREHWRDRMGAAVKR